MNDLQQSNSIRIKLSLPLEIMTQLFVLEHEIKCRQRKGKKDRRAFFFYIQIRKTILLPLTHWHVIRLSGFFTFLISFSSPFTLRNLANNKVLCFYEKKWEERKPSAFHSTLLQGRKKICDVLKSLGILRSFGRYVSGPAMFLLYEAYILVRERNIAEPLEAKHCQVNVCTT